MSEMIDKSIREIEREKTRSSSSRKEADHGAKKNAEQGQMGAVGVTAKTWYERDIRLKSSRSLNHNSRCAFAMIFSFHYLCVHEGNVSYLCFLLIVKL
ncbi:hypothetical protein MANES_11G021700v8 [Manihot esculenta]|uniref:Uncharacterized protein n=1 Tax=Manihot esculenta TaxID=3983 RepID=A0A2C9UZN5_MANES|nr:hypothetical protein MANES_11G021700v8 [Manihot esculenta]